MTLTVEEAITIVIHNSKNPFSSAWSPEVEAMQFLEREARKAQKYREALEWIGDQFCKRRPEESEEGYTPCTETDMCCTEWCLPCHASKALEDK